MRTERTELSRHDVIQMVERLHGEGAIVAVRGWVKVNRPVTNCPECPK
jgi:hypothetical protein